MENVLMNNSNRENEIMLEVCLEQSNMNELSALVDYSCLKDLVKLQDIHSIINKFSRTKSGALRKGSTFFDLLDKRLDLAVEQIKEYSIEDIYYQENN